MIVSESPIIRPSDQAGTMTDEQKRAKARLAVAFLLAVSCAAPTPAQGSPPLATELVNVVVANEPADRVER